MTTPTHVSDLTIDELTALIRKTVKEALTEHDQSKRDESEATTQPTGRFTIYDLLKLPEEEQKRIMEESIASAIEEDYEIFEAM